MLRTEVKLLVCMSSVSGIALNVLVRWGMFLCCIQQAIPGFFVISLSPSRLMLQYYFKISHNHFHSHTCQFIISIHVTVFWKIYTFDAEGMPLMVLLKLHS